MLMLYKRLFHGLSLFNHHNCARWASVHLHDIITLHKEHPKVAEQFAVGRFTVHKIQRFLSAIALHQTHEQFNAHIKGVGGMNSGTKQADGSWARDSSCS
jgi:hypothetical protein